MLNDNITKTHRQRRGKHCFCTVYSADGSTVKANSAGRIPTIRQKRRFNSAVMFNVETTQGEDHGVTFLHLMYALYANVKMYEAFL